MKKLLLLPVFGLALIFWFASKSAPEVAPVETIAQQCQPKTLAPAAGKPVVRGRTPLETAQKAFATYGIQVQDYHELRPSVSYTPVGSFVTYEIYQDGLPIVGMSIRMRLNRNNEVVSVEDEYRPLPKADTTPRLSAVEVADQAIDRYEFSSTDASREAAGKILFARKPDESPELAWAMSMDCGPTPCQVVLRASDGQLLARHLSRAEVQRAPKF